MVELLFIIMMGYGFFRVISLLSVLSMVVVWLYVSMMMEYGVCVWWVLFSGCMIGFFLFGF